MPPRPVPDAGPSLRSWQRKALVTYLRQRADDFLAVATPGAGKTTFALRVAAELLAVLAEAVQHALRLRVPS